MHVLGRRRGTLSAALILAALTAFAPAPAAAKPAPGYQPQGFRLFSRAAFRWVGNRVQCFLASTGQVCTPESSVIGGGYWPAGTNNQYIFNSGLQVAGIVDSNSVGNPWRGNIDGAFFFNARGGGNGQGLTNIFNSADAADLANWPTIAYVPTAPDPQADLFDPALQGAKTASDNDVWFMSWEGDPSNTGGRNHPLGLAVETRGLAYSTPGKNDFLFFIYTFYNITADGRTPTTPYDNAPPRIRDSLKVWGSRFQDLNNAKLATSLPQGGYTITDMFLAFGADMDVTSEDAGNNYDGVNIPMSLGYTYHKSFTAPSSWTFDPAIYAPPFFPGAGFIGVKYLKSPEVNGVERGLTLFGATTNGGEFSDPRNTAALYRYLTGKLDPTQGDNACNVGNVLVTKICYINQGAANDMRFFQASGPLTLAPGEFSSIAVAYIFAPPMASGACTGPDVCPQVRPQDRTDGTESLTRMFSPDSIVLGVNTVDTITGYLGYTGDNNPANGIIDEAELNVQPGSLLGKAKAAQSIFGTKFAQPAAPTAPQYFLIPGDNQVSIVWQPSTTENLGDPYFQAATSVASYDPNYRQFDVAGYRIYRGLRSDATNLQLLVQFDKTGDVMQDFTGQVNSTDGRGFTDCAPDLGVFNSCTSAGLVNGVNTIDPIDVTLDGPVTQYISTSIIPSGMQAVALKVDTAITGENSGLPGLSGSGIPFLFTDKAGACTRCGVRNHTRYFYIVTAFDINSIRSGNSSLESNKSGPKNTTPVPVPSNITSLGQSFPLEFVGRNGALTDNTAPTIDPADGRFSKAFPPANAGSIQFLGGIVSQIFSAPGTISAELKRVHLGDARNGVPSVYDFLFTNGNQDTSTISVSLDPGFSGSGASFTSGPTPFAIPDSVLLLKYGLPATTVAPGTLSLSIPIYQPLSAWGRGCADGGISPFSASNCLRNGPRWFEGANETVPDPNIANTGSTATNFNNSGALTGVSTIYTPHSFLNVDNDWRRVEATLYGAVRAADFQLTWGAGGKIASVEDLTHDVAVPFDSTELGGGFAIMTQQNSNFPGSFDGRPGVLTVADFGCVEPFLTGGGSGGWGGTAPCGAGTPYALTDSVTLGPVAIHNGTSGNLATAPTLTDPGFAMYLAGHLFIFEMTGGALPAAGTVWKMRSYAGTVTFGGTGTNATRYRFIPVTRPFTAIGLKMQLRYDAIYSKVKPTVALLDNVHTVPDPYYVTHSLETASDNKIIKFVNLPTRAIIRIYSSSGVLVRVLGQNTDINNELTWDVRNRNGQFVASGVYFYHIEAGNARRVGRMTIVNFAK